MSLSLHAFSNNYTELKVDSERELITAIFEIEALNGIEPGMSGCGESYKISENNSILVYVGVGYDEYMCDVLEIKSDEMDLEQIIKALKIINYSQR